MKVNILIDQGRHARLADFGLLTIVWDHTNFTTSSTAHSGGTMRWMSPELLHPEQFGLDHVRPTKAADCYALGMVILEVLTGQPPFASWPGHVVSRKVTDGRRPGRPEGAAGIWFTDELWEMLGLCWATDAQCRPSIEAVCKCLEQVSSSWKPLQQQVNEGAEKYETDWDLTALTVWVPVFILFHLVVIYLILHQKLLPLEPEPEAPLQQSQHQGATAAVQYVSSTHPFANTRATYGVEL